MFEDPIADHTFIARDEELAVLLAEVAPTERQEGSMGAVVAGSAGVGKTRLVREFADRVDADPILVVGTHAEALIPYGAIAHLAPGTTVHDHDDLVSWYGAVRAALGGRRRVVVVDDAHLLDPGSAALILHLAVTATVPVVATVRTGEPCPDPITALWRDRMVRRIDLQPFSDAEAEDLVRRLLGGTVAPRATGRLTRLCRGNALFLHEIVTAARASGALGEVDGVWRWSGEIPRAPRLVDAVEARLIDLDDAQRYALATIALGEPLAVDMVLRLAGGDALEFLEQRGLVTVTRDVDGAWCRCTHPLYGEVLIDGMGYFRRRRLAGDLADAMAASGPESAEVRLATTRRRLEAGRDVSAAELTDAAVTAGDAFDFTLAEHLARTALEEGENPDASVVLARALNGQGHPGDANDVLADAEEGVLRGGSTSLVERYLDTRFNILHLSLGRRDESAGMLDRITAAASGRKTREGRDLVDLAAAYRARILVHDGFLQQTVELAAGVLDRPDTPRRARLHALQTTGEALAYQGRTTTARTVHERMRALAATGAREVAVGAVWADMQEALCLSQEGRVDEAAGIVEQAERAMRAEPDDEARGLVSLALAAVRLGQGRPVSARSSLRDALYAYRRFDPGGGRVWANAMLTQVEAMLGDVDGARRAAAAFHAERDRHGGVRALLDFALADAFVEVVEGRVGRAPQILLDTADRCDDMPMLQVRALHLAAMLGANPDPLVGPLQELAAETECDFPLLCADHAAGLAGGDAASLESVAERFANLGLMLRAAEVAAQAAAAFGSQAIRSGATRCAARSRVLAARCEGASTPALEGLIEGPDLTRRELEVARLAARGVTNRRIADELGVSVRTVESHLYQAFAKLGVERRTGLADVLGLSTTGGVPGETQ